MNDLRIPGIVYGFLLAIGVLDWVRRYPLLPARMASHGQFNIAATLAVLFGGIPGNLDDIVAASLQSHY
jgi:hypothetical protein